MEDKVLKYGIFLLCFMFTMPILLQDWKLWVACVMYFGWPYILIKGLLWLEKIHK